ncbi:MarR family transcriptional regulator [Psychromarinibacter sp. C21-152]|uniref:MarR family transcriptional regulator n=1 Tax=Psychromarinibacter sediminicola TaxID=3033385 RepID=A0AAE3TBQ9_9RHOB|nr:MarR family transcriptional regulator [Psychromarinibacter sediminicola]MDF0602875.1 MarR family transcriptional regulator [Psychromarinibacter sediminicola]
MDAAPRHDTGIRRRSYGGLTEMSGFLLSLAQAHVYAADSANPQIADPGTAQISVLAVIRANPGIRHGELADMLLIKLAYLTKLLKGFEAQGWVHRRSNPSDRRTVELTLTREGEAAVDRLLPALRAQDARRQSGLTPREMAQLKRLLCKYLDIPASATTASGDDAAGSG